MYIHTGAQDVVISIVNPESQERLCPDQPVVFQCQFLAGIAALVWRFPNWKIGYLTSELVVGYTQIFGQFTANVTGRDPGVYSLVNTTLTVQPPLDDLNNTAVECVGLLDAYPMSLANDTTNNTTLSGKDYAKFVCEN